MFRASFRAPEDAKEELLDALLPLLPAGVREDGDDAVHDRRRAAGPRGPGGRAGRALEGWEVAEVPGRLARAARARGRGRASSSAGRVCDPLAVGLAAGRGVIDVVVERRGERVRLGLAPDDADVPGAAARARAGRRRADLGCGVGTLAIAAAKLGWAPVVAVDRVPVAIEVARENVERNEVDVECAVADLAVDDVPLAPLLLVNAPPPVHERVVASMTPEVRHVIVSGIVAEEVEAVLAGYRVRRLRGRPARWGRRTSGSRCA